MIPAGSPHPAISSGGQLPFGPPHQDLRKPLHQFRSISPQPAVLVENVDHDGQHVRVAGQPHQLPLRVSFTGQLSPESLPCFEEAPFAEKP